MQLKPHKKVETRFEIGQLVTIQFDFNQTMSNSNNETFTITIQAGQIGIISKTHALDTTLDNDCVEVTFWSMSLGKLIKKAKNLVFHL